MDRQPGMVITPACGQVKWGKYKLPVPIRAWNFGLASKVRLSRGNMSHLSLANGRNPTPPKKSFKKALSFIPTKPVAEDGLNLHI